MVKRWWTYQRERFPVLAHGVLIAAFSLAAVGYTALVLGRREFPAEAAVVAFAGSFLFFVQLRIADEFKDFDEDTRYRPQRPVPRGLVSLRELGVLAGLAALAQLALAVWLKPVLVVPLVGAWAYLALMTVEFFAPAVGVSAGAPSVRVITRSARSASGGRVNVTRATVPSSCACAEAGGLGALPSDDVRAAAEGDPA